MGDPTSALTTVLLVWGLMILVTNAAFYLRRRRWK